MVILVNVDLLSNVSSLICIVVDFKGSKVAPLLVHSLVSYAVTLPVMTKGQRRDPDSNRGVRTGRTSMTPQSWRNL